MNREKCAEEEKLHRLRKMRVARVKRFLRWMPRRANVHTYPVLKWFAAGFRKRSYLWCFRCPQAIPAIYAGTIIGVLPLLGVQIPLAILAALILRANLPILFSLQFITNPLTILPLYYCSYNIGKLCLFLFGHRAPAMNLSEIGMILHSIQNGLWKENFFYIGKAFLVTSLGALILGVFFATIGAAVYRLSAREIAVSRERLKHLQQRRTGKRN